MTWLAEQNTPTQAWRTCQRGDWMLWLLVRVNDSAPWSDGRKPLLACCLDCAETVKHLWRESSRDKIAESFAILRRWIDGEATVEQARTARMSLYGTAYAAAADAAACAAYAACAGDATIATSAKLARFADIAAIVRQHFPKPPKISTPTEAV